MDTIGKIAADRTAREDSRRGAWTLTARAPREPVSTRSGLWPGWARLLVVLGGALLAWAGVIAGVIWAVSRMRG